MMDSYCFDRSSAGEKSDSDDIVIVIVVWTLLWFFHIRAIFRCVYSYSYCPCCEQPL